MENILRRRRSNRLLDLSKKKQLFSTKPVSSTTSTRSSLEQYDSGKDKDYIPFNLVSVDR